MRQTPQPDSAGRRSGQLRKRLGLLAVALATASVPVVLVLAPKPPQFSGKTATQWAMMLDAHVDKRKEHTTEPPWRSARSDSQPYQRCRISCGVALARFPNSSGRAECDFTCSGQKPCFSTSSN